ncbi:MAG: VWA domain-containing protein [Gemmatimonadota bacterium]|nr:VWA domain-containing protein [Gemmatimonadota bacterium]
MFPPSPPSRVLLHFFHTLTNAADRVHTFVFGTRLTNITRLLRDRDVDRALDRIGHTVRDWYGYRGFAPRAAGIRALLPEMHEHRPVHNLDSLAQLAEVLGGRVGGLAGKGRSPASRG